MEEKLYEVTFLVRQEVSQADVKKIAHKFEKLIAEKGGKLVRDEHWGLRSTAYPINKSSKAHYVHFLMKGQNSTISSMEKQMKLDENIMRFLTVKTNHISKTPSQLATNTKEGE